MDEIYKSITITTGSTLITAMILLHKFIVSHFTTFNQMDFQHKVFYISASMLSSLKINNLMIPQLQMAEIASKIILRKCNRLKAIAEKNNQSFTMPEINKTEIGNQIAAAEEDILISINFDINIDLPFSFLAKINSYLKTKFPKLSKELFKLILDLIGNSYALPVSLFFNPNTIVLANLCNLYNKFNYINIDEMRSLSDYPVSLDDAMKCANILRLCSPISDGHGENKNEGVAHPPQTESMKPIMDIKGDCKSIL